MPATKDLDFLVEIEAAQNIHDALLELGYQCLYRRSVNTDGLQPVDRWGISSMLPADRAAVRGRPIAIEFLPDGYRFSALDPDDNWRPLIDPPVFTDRAVPAGVSWLGLRIDGQPDASSPRLQFGTQAPEYELRVATPAGEARFTGKANGTVQLAMPGANRS